MRDIEGLEVWGAVYRLDISRHWLWFLGCFFLVWGGVGLFVCFYFGVGAGGVCVLNSVLTDDNLKDNLKLISEWNSS